MDIDIVNQNLAASRLNKTHAKASASTSAQKELKEKQLKEAAEGFESILIHTMLKSMRKSLPGNAVFPESNSMNIYQSMYDQYLADKLTSQNSMNLKIAYFEGRPHGHPTHSLYAKSVGADFFHFDLYLPYHEKRTDNKLLALISWILTALFLMDC